MEIYPLWMAPMAGVTDKPFRTIIRELGCGLAFTEMISGKAIQFKNRRTWKMLNLEGEHPIGVQLFGSDPEVLAQAARVAEAEGADLIDLNMGCPVPKIVGNGEGAALMRNPDLAWAIVNRVARAVSVPVTVKIRAGWNEDSLNALPFAQGAVQNGAAAISVHGRTRAQMYSGKADWNVITQVANGVAVPVIGNGDIWTGKDALAMLGQTGCNGVMLARGVLGNPWLFAEVSAAMAGRQFAPPSVRERMEIAVRHLRLELAYREKRMAVTFMRKHLAWYLKGLPGTASMRKDIFQQTSPDIIADLLLAYADKFS